MTKPITAEQFVDALWDGFPSSSHIWLSTGDRPSGTAKFLTYSAVLAKLVEFEKSLYPQWRPIAEAPRDATPILVGLISDGKVWRVSDAKFYGVGFYTLHGGQSCHWATHYQPLLTPPEES